MTTHVAAKPVVINRHDRFITAAAVSCAKAFRVPPVFLRSGGTNPAVAALQKTLGVPVALVGLGLRDDRIHAPNERFHLPNLLKGIATSILFMNEVAVISRSANTDVVPQFVSRERTHASASVSHDY
jgi:acetylornithine deacetylase/succinyl-diaminopimelate desuccinylase-like protein